MTSKSKKAKKGMNILVLNCGSSSLKFQIIDTDLKKIESNSDEQKARGLVERIGGQSIVTLNAIGKKQVKQTLPLRDHRSALDYVLRWMIAPETGIPGIRSLADINAVGHRVVHGAERFKKSVLIDEDVIKGIEDCIDLAPLHNPANLKGINAARELFGSGVPQVA
ncbi:MAG: acetate kinase, partial [Limisphaerales bacterium]